MELHLWILLWITPISGSLGGVINFFLLDDETQNKVGDSVGTVKRGWFYRLSRSIIIGIGAAFVVPLFLQTISSSLMNDCQNKSQLFFVYAGFCLIASIFSRRFLDTVAERALKTAQKADEKSTLALDKTEELKPLQLKATEGDDNAKDDEEINEADEQYLESDIRQKIKVDIKEIKKAFQNSKYAYRTSKGIAKGINSDEGVVLLILEEMEDAGLAKRIINKENNKTLWTLIK
jgi:hypothetical protein